MFKINTKQRYIAKRWKIIDFCKYYTLEDNLENLSFNRKFSELEMKKFLTQRYNYTKRFYIAIAERIRNISNIIIFISGTQNSGKSEMAQSIAKFIQYCLWKYAKKKVDIYFGFSTADFNKIMIEMRIGDVGIRDESSQLSGVGSVNAEKDLDNVMRAVRVDQNSFIFVDPTDLRSPLVYYYLETAGKKSIHTCVKCKREYLNIPKIQKKCIRCGETLELIYSRCKCRLLLYDKKHNLLGHIYLPLHWDTIFRKRYNVKKNENLLDLKANAGTVNAEIDYDRLERDTNILLKLSYKKGAKNKGEVYGLIAGYNAQQKNKKDRIIGNTNYIAILTTNVNRILREERNDFVRINNDTLNIVFDDKVSFSKFCLNNIEDKSEAKVADGLARGDSLRTIRDNYPELSESFIKNIALKLRGTNYKYNMGFMFEKWFALKIGVPLDKLKEVLGGATNKPDLIWNDEVYTIKWRYNSKEHSKKFSQKKDFAPEYKYVKENNLDYYYLIFMNPKWSLKIQKKKILNGSPDEVFVYKDN